MADLGKCRACPAGVLWCEMVELVDGRPVKKMKDGKPVRNPLDADPLSDEELSQLTLGDQRRWPGVIAYSPRSGNGLALSIANFDQIGGWISSGVVRMHRSHFATCPERGQFRSKK
jgi:hypothetical protein